MYCSRLPRCPAIRTVSGETFDLAEGVVYPVLHALEARGLLKAREKMAEGRSRIYYSLTGKGAKRLAALVAEWERVNRGINSVLEPSHG
jgi:PadR family transcriptional regulator, regulatory protein PadR